MRGGALPAALLCAALGLMLAFAPKRAMLRSVLVACTVAVLTSRISIADRLIEACFVGCWAGVIALAFSVHLPRGVPFQLAVIGGGVAGMGSGLVIAANGRPSDLLRALPCCLIAIPGGLFRQRGAGIALKVVSSWLIAVALLVALLPLAKTPGYVPDHME